MQTNKKISFYFLITVGEPFLLLKDVGMIPFYLYNAGYDVHFVSHISPIDATKPENATYFKRVAGIKFEYVPPSGRIFGFSWNLIKYIWSNAKKMDILLIYFYKSAMLPSLIYKLRNKNGKIWVKCDMDGSSYNNYPSKATFVGKIKNKIFEQFAKKGYDLITAESNMAVDFLRNYYPQSQHKIRYLPDGVDDIWFEKQAICPLPYEQKENIILTVGRLGTFQKNTEFLLECMEEMQWQGDWKIVAVAGSGTTPEFAPKLETFFEKNPHFRERFELVPNLQHKELFEYYRRAKIVCCTSRFESFGLFIAEGLSMGDYVVTTPICTAPDFVQGGCGVEVQTPDEMASFLSSVMVDETALQEAYPRVLEHAKDFYWSNIINTLQTYWKELHLIS